MNSKLNTRRKLLIGSLLSFLSPLVMAQDRADSPGKTVKIIIGFPPGQATDSVTRLLADKLRAVTGNNYVVDNRPGQGGSIALAAVAKAPNDGSIMSVIHMSAMATNPHLYSNVPYDSLKDFEPVGLVGDLPFVLVCNPTLPFKSVKELIAYAKANPDKLTNASSGNGTVSHLAMEKFKRDAGIKITHVPYKGSVAGLTDVISGNVSIALETASSVRPHIESGKLRALAVGSSRELGGVFAGVPTLAQSGFKDINAVTWLMIIYPAGTSKSTVNSTFAALSTVMSNPEVEQRMLAIGCIPRVSKSPEEATTYLRSEYKYWGDAVKASGIKLE